jgi:flagellar basal body P-ring formation protein FlgA
MKSPRFRVLAALCLAWCLIGLRLDISADGTADSPVDAVEIRVLARGKTSSRTVVLGDVAELTGGSDAFREHLAKIDLGDVPANALQASVKKRQIDFRLKIAEVPARSIRLVGDEECIVHLERQSVTRDEIAEAAKAAILKRLPWPARELELSLAKPIVAVLPEADRSDVTFRIEPHAPSVGLGRMQMDVNVLVRGEHKLSLPVYFDVRLIQPVLVARRSLATGEILIDENSLTDRRAVDAQARIPQPATLLGKRIRRPVAAGQLLTDADVIDEPVAAAKAAVKSRQPVKMVVRLANYNVEANGEAMQDGKIGDRVQVRNIDSKKVLYGRVTGPGTVEVE